MKNETKFLVLFMAIALILPFSVEARLVLDNIQLDPAIVTSGDEVDVIVQFHDEVTGEEDWRGNPDYKFNIELVHGDTQSKEFITLQDSEGDTLSSVTVYSAQYYNQKFRIKVNNDAPAGNYELRVEGQWYKKGEPFGSIQFVRFMVPVKREGIILDMTTIQSSPAEVRPGDNYVKILGYVENSGEKPAKSVVVNVDLPEGLTSSYSSENRVSVGRINTGESREMTFYVDVDDKAEPGLYYISYRFDYMDLDNNKYQIIKTLPFRVKERPYLEVVSSEGEGLAGGDATLKIVVKNTGTESAESIDVRILKQNSQPFEFDVRSNYIGELEPGEEGIVFFDIRVLDHAEIKEHDLKVLIRAKGDSDEGDDNIYTFSRRAKLDVTGEKSNYYGIIGLSLAAAVIIFIAVRSIVVSGRRKRK